MKKISAKSVTIGAIATAILVGSLHGGVGGFIHALVEKMLHPSVAEATLQDSKQIIENHGSHISGIIRQKTPLDLHPSSQVIRNTDGAKIVGDITQEITSVR